MPRGDQGLSGGSREPQGIERWWPKGVPKPKVYDPTGAYPQPGKKLCSWCHQKCPGRRRRWCSDRCRGAFWQTTDWEHVRRIVLDRDKWRCHFCGIDCDLVQRIVSRLNEFGNHVRWTAPKLALLVGHRWESEGHFGHPAAWRLCRVVGWKKFGQSFAEVDHIVPRIDGGHDAPDNLRCACQRCHAKHTAQQNSERAKYRRRKKKTKMGQKNLKSDWHRRKARQKAIERQRGRGR